MRYERAVFFGIVICAICAPLFSFADTTDNQRQALQAQLDDINKEIQQNQAQLALRQTERTSLERDVAILDSKIQQAQLEIKRRNLTIKQLKNGIADKEAGIRSLDSQVEAGEESLAQILRRTQQVDDIPFAQRALEGSFSDLFSDISVFEIIQRSLGESFVTMATQRTDLSARKAALQDQQEEEQDLLQIQVLQQNALKATEKQKQDLVAAARGQESIYLQIIAGKQKSAAQIQSALFALAGGTRSTSFGDIYTYAKEASARTGVRPAFILAILREESNLGQNVGKGNWKTDMHPTRDVPLFAQICASLGLDPNTQPVSKRQSYGWGGAMGPAQFIPSTWMLYKDRITNATGQNPADPWDPRTATFATAIYMEDLGADAQTPVAERRAALKYLAGSRWQNPSYAFYGNEVMAYAEEYQRDIDVLTAK